MKAQPQTEGPLSDFFDVSGSFNELLFRALSVATLIQSIC